MWFFLVFLLPLLAAAETGGLQELPFPPGTDIERSVNVIANGNFDGSSDWSLGAWTQDATTTRTPDGSGSLRITNQGSTETQATQNIASETLNQYRIFRLRAWLRASAPPGESAQFRIYFFQRGSARFCGVQLNLQTVGTEWKEYTAEIQDCRYLHTYPPHLEQSMQVRLMTRNIPSGVNVWVDDVSLTPVVRPLVIFPTYPNYRGMVWPDQGTTIKWNAIVEPPDGETLGGLKVRVQVVKASNSQVVDTVETSTLAPPVSSLQSLWYRYSVTPMQYDASGLSDGSYYLRGTLRRVADDGELYAYPDYKIVKEAPSVQRDNWKVWVDKYNRTVINGKPRFIWGTYASFSAGRHTFPTGASTGSTNPDSYRALAGGCDAGGNCNENTHRPVTNWSRKFGLGNATLIKQWADVGLNAVPVYAAFGTYDSGFSTPVPGFGHSATGTITTSGTTVTGTGTQFGTEILEPASELDFGDTIRINGRPGTGTITHIPGSDGQVTGVGTRFTSEIMTGDQITANGKKYYVRSVTSDTSLTIIRGTQGDPPWNGHSFTYDQIRKVVSVGGVTSATINAPFTPDVSASAFGYERCASGGVRYGSPDRIGAFITAIQDHDMWYWHIVGNIGGVESGFWAHSSWAPRCNLLTREEHTRWLTRFRPLGAENGFLGFYLSDEPTYDNPRIGVQASYEYQKGHRDAGYGGLSFWVDGWAPRHAWDQWNNFADSWQPDPYPAHGSGGANPDDFGYGITAWNKHGRSWHWPRRSLGSGFDARPVHTAIQLFAWTSVVSSYPQVSDNKIQIVSALAAGSHGILWWATAAGGGGLSGRVAGADAYSAWRKSAKYVQALLPILEQPIQDLAGREDGEPDYGRIIASVSDPAIKCSTRRRGDVRLLACANTTDSDKTVTITTVDPIPGPIQVPWDGSTITPLTSTTFTHTFKGLNGGTQTAGAGTVSSSGTTVTCSGCNFQSTFGTLRNFAFPTLTAGGSTRLVTAVSSPTSITVDIAPSVSNQSWTYSSDANKERAVEIFVIEPPAGNKTRPVED